MNSSLSANERAKLLLSQLSLEEKVFQMGCTIYVGEDHKDRPTVLPNGIGSVAIYGGLSSRKENRDFISKLQKEIISQNKFGIPALFHVEALSGAVLSESSAFPTAIGLGASFDEVNIKEMSRFISNEVKASGIRQTLSPVLDVARDYRWGRISETFGEDPTLISQLGCAYVEGFQGTNLTSGVACTAKHFLGYGASEGALNMTGSVITDNELHEIYRKPFEAAIRKSDIKSVMNSYSSLNGEAIVSSKKIMNDMLRNDMGFNGLTVTDYGSVQRLTDVFKTAEDHTDAAIQCVRAGIDTECPAPITYMNLIKAVKEGKLDESELNESVQRVLTLKFELGLFENPYPEETTNIQNADELMSKLVKKTLTLTKNEDLLPIKKEIKKIAVIGPCGNSLRSFFSTYSYGGLIEILELKKKNKEMDIAIAGVSDTMAAIRQPDIDDDEIEAFLRNNYPNAKTIFEALSEVEGLDVSYNKGCHIKNDTATIDDAVALAKHADMVILALGGRNGWGFACTTGEGIDATDITLTGHQNELMKRVHAVNSNVALLHFDGHPVVDAYAYEQLPSILECWLPGEKGGSAIADVLLGLDSPAGRLPITVPRSIGQTPCYHYQYNGSGFKSMILGGVNPDGYIDETALPRLPFGHGLSYAEVEYSNTKMSLIRGSKTPVIEVKTVITNNSDLQMDEVVQIYGCDCIASRVRPNQELLGFKRIELAPGESRTVIFEVDLSQLAMYKEGQWLLEKGTFEIKLSKNAWEDYESQKFVIDESFVVTAEERAFFATSVIK